MPHDPAILDDDCVMPFCFGRAPIRGRTARLSQTLRALLEGRNYPSAVKPVVAETALLATLIGQLAQPGWKFSIQISSGGPIRLAVADYFVTADQNDPAKLRATAAYDDRIKALADVPPWNESGGHFVCLMDRNDGSPPSRGIVPLNYPKLAACAEDYFRLSEQIPTSIAVTVGQSVEAGRQLWRGGGIVIQRMPKSGAGPPGGGLLDTGQASEDWARAAALLTTVDPLELTGPACLMLETLHRLFHEENPRAGRCHPVHFGCTCSARKFRQVLSVYPADDLAEMTSPEGKVTADCRFCGRRYEFELSGLGAAAAGDSLAD